MENKTTDNFIYPGKNSKNLNIGNSEFSSFIQRVNNSSDTTKNININDTTRKKSVIGKISKKIFHKYHGKCIFRIIYASSILGIFIIIVTFFPSVLGAINNNSKFTQYDKFIWPVVMQDPDIFSENNPPSNELLLDASIWKAASEKNKDSCNYDIKGRVILSVEEIKVACNDLFGDEYNISLENMNLMNKFYEYNSESQIFYVDAISYDQCFIPKTVNLTEYENLIVLTVNYVNIDENAKLNNKSSLDSRTNKHMEYFLKKRSDSSKFYISEIRKITHNC